MSLYYRLLSVALVVLLPLGFGCTQRGAREPTSRLEELRKQAAKSEDFRVLSEWLLAELFVPGGDSRQARTARARLDQALLRPGEGDRMLAHLGRGLDDLLHGELVTAPDHFLRAVEAARSSSDERAPYVAWLAAHRAVALSDNDPKLWERWSGFVDQATRNPGHLGWRARVELVEWWADEAYEEATRDVEDLAAQKLGCLEHVRLAGPFGRGAKLDVLRSFSAERPGPWPLTWTPETGVGEAPHLLEVDRHGCTVFSDEPTGDGVFYAESFVELRHPQRVLLAVQGAVTVWVDDARLLDRDPRQWGIWNKFGTELMLSAGRHRILAKLDAPRTSVRLMNPDGTPFRVESSKDSAPIYGLVPPEATGEPNLISRHVRDGDVRPIPDFILRLLIASLALVEGQADVASVVAEPFVKDLESATGPALVLAASFVERDPVFGSSQTRDLMRELHQRARDKDPRLWRAELAMAEWEGERAGATAAVTELTKLVTRFPNVPAVTLALAQRYGQLGWTSEYAALIKQLALRFPEQVEALTAAAEVYKLEGNTREHDRLVERVRKLDPDSEIVVTEALERHDYERALSELERLGRRRPDRKDIAGRIYGVKVQAGNVGETWKKLEAEVEENPKDGAARLALADATFAAGSRDALHRALVDAIQAGASAEELEQALDLVEGITELEPYRLSAKSIIEAYEKSGQHMPGHAARVLDYAAVWIKSDGSSRMLEHEVVRIQSTEAVQKMSEHPQLDGVVLHLRVIKKDGRVLEPEAVPGKPSVTFPHLEVGDYIETEHIISQAGDGQHGMVYVGPHWFFREANIAYARSEFVVISPRDKQLIVETEGNVPPPRREDSGNLEVRRWRVDQSPAAPVEPMSPPITEFLPSVRIAWGVSLEKQLRRYSDLVVTAIPVDPRIRRMAEKIVEPLPASARTERAKRLYRWVLANVTEGEESDGRRVVIGKQGNRTRGYQALCEALGIRVDFAVARNRLAPPPKGDISRAMLYSELAVRVQGDKPIWLTVASKYAPFGYLPAEVRAMPAALLTGPPPRSVILPAGGALDGLEYHGELTLQPDGSALMDLSQVYAGRHAMAAREQLAQLPENRLPDELQGQVSQILRGARLVDYEVKHLTQLDSPLTLKAVIAVERFADVAGSTLTIAPPFVASITRLTALPTRQTPLLIPQATYRRVKLRIELPAGAKVLSPITPGEISAGDHKVTIADHLEGNVLLLDRTVVIPAGRITPEEYPDFIQFARRADDAQSSTIRIKLAAVKEL